MHTQISTGRPNGTPIDGLWSQLTGYARRYGPEDAVRQMHAASVDSFAKEIQSRAAAPLPDDAQRLFDRGVVNVGRERLAIADAVINAGLTFDLQNWLAVPDLYWEQLDDVGNVRVVMDPSSRMDASLPAREGKTMPIPAIISDFQFGVRTQLASERAGVPIDTTMFEQATRRVNEQIEDIFINGWAAVGGNSIFGLLNAPNANTNAYVDSEAWDAAGHSGADIQTDVIAMANALKNDNFFGPYTLFIPTDYENEINKLFTDGTTTQPRTTRQVLEDMRFGGQNLRIVTADQLPDDRTVLVQMTSNVIQAVVGQMPAPLSWGDGGPGWNTNHAVLACVLPRIRDTYDDTSGICTGNTS